MISRFSLLSSCALGALVMYSVPVAQAQISKPSDTELNAAPVQFQDLVHGRSDKINQNVRPDGGGPPPGAGGGAKPAVNPSKDPHDLRGNWLRGGPGGEPGDLAPGGGAGGPAGPGGAAAGGPAGPGGGGGPPGPGGPGGGGKDLHPGWTAHSEIDANRICLVSLGVSMAPAKIYQAKNQLTFVYGNELRARRIYFADRHAANVKATYNGDSIAHWEGDTLVVDTIGIKGLITLTGFDLENGVHDAVLVNPMLHVVERINKSADGQQLTVQSVWTDPASKNSGYSATTTLNYMSDAPSYDAVCEDVGDHFGPNYAGSVK